MANHHLDAVRLQLTGGVDYMPKHGLASHWVQHFRQRRTHASALPGGENDYIERHAELPEFLGTGK
jgi:hypothetical protein